MAPHAAARTAVARANPNRGEIRVVMPRIQALVFRVRGRMPAGVLASPLTGIDWARRLGVPLTMRNWNTVLKLAAMAEGHP